jgi:hypothetical protein
LAVIYNTAAHGTVNRIQAPERMAKRLTGDRIAFYAECVLQKRVHGQYQPVAVNDHQSAWERIEDGFYEGVICDELSDGNHYDTRMSNAGLMAVLLW